MGRGRRPGDMVRRKGSCRTCPPAMEVMPMPTFSTLPIGEARARSATGKPAALPRMNTRPFAQPDHD